MKSLQLIFITILIPLIGMAQKKIHQEIMLDGATKTSMYFKWPDQVTVKYHNKNTILIEGNVTINNGRYDDAFKIDYTREDKTIMVNSEVQGMDTMEHITVIKENGKGDKVVFKNEKDQIIINNGSQDQVSTGIIMDILLVIYLPYDHLATIEAKFGLIEVVEVKGPLIVNSKFGGVDISIDEKEKLDLKAGTAFGEIFSNLDMNFRGNGELEKIGNWHRITSTFESGGRQLDVESKFGNIYLRKK